MTVEAQCKKIAATLESLKGTEVRARTVKSLEAKHRELSAARVALRDQLDRGKEYDETGYPLRLAPIGRGLSEQLRDLANRVNQDPSPENLSDGPLWKNLRSGLEQATFQAGRSVDAARADFCDRHSTIVSPDELKPRLALTGDNPQLLREYRDAYARLRELLRAAVHSAAEIRTVHEELWPQLNKVLQAMDTDVPDAVKKFLHAAETHAGAPLADLSPEVMSWLQNKKMTPHFRVTKVK